MVERPVALTVVRLNTANVILFGVTAAELAFLVAVTPAFDFVDWMIYRIDREERILAHDGRGADYARSVRYRMLPGIW